MVTKHKAYTAFYLALLVLTLAACAKMGAPDGGWYDETPPRIFACTPDDQGVNVTAQKITIFFDEYIQIDNPTEKVIISPPQIEQAEVKGAGKKIVVQLKDTLKANTTYTVDFSDAITDNNESNPLGNYTYSFSTGDHIDTLEVAGYVLNAEDLEPIKGILVGLYANLADTAFTTEPMLRVSRTDGGGRFVIKGVAPGSYRIYALADADNNYLFSQKSEQLAFTEDIIVPSFKPDVRQDTIWRDSLHIDSIRQVPYTHFLPDDIVLRAFTETQTTRYLIKTERKQADCFSLFFSYGNEQLPIVSGLNFNSDNAFIVEPSAKGDTVTYWLRDTALVNQDTLRLELQYLATDTLGALQLLTDTLEVLSKDPYEKRMKREQDAREEWAKKQEKAKKKDQPYETEYPLAALEPKYNIQAEPDPNQNVEIVMPAPLAAIDTAAIHLYAKHDTLWYRAPMLFRAKANAHRTYEVLGEWRPGIEYSLEIDTLCFTDIYGKSSKPFKKGFKVKGDEEFATLLMTIDGFANDSLVVQLLDNGGQPVKTVITTNSTAEFFYITPGTYYVRLFLDTNGNGLWDTGLYADHLQPERTYYYPEKIECKAKWDITLTWNPTARPLHRQKPQDITKQKAEKAKEIKQRNAERAKQKGIPYPQ